GKVEGVLASGLPGLAGAAIRARGEAGAKLGGCARIWFRRGASATARPSVAARTHSRRLAAKRGTSRPPTTRGLRETQAVTWSGARPRGLPSDQTNTTRTMDRTPRTLCRILVATRHKLGKVHSTKSLMPS